MKLFLTCFSSLFLSLPPCDVSTDSARGGLNDITFSISIIYTLTFTLSAMGRKVRKGVELRNFQLRFHETCPEGMNNLCSCFPCLSNIVASPICRRRPLSLSRLLLWPFLDGFSDFLSDGLWSQLTDRVYDWHLICM
jgi:hypothetical protein